MYDTIGLTIQQHDHPEIDFVNDIPQHLTGIMSDGESRIGRFISGYINNFKVSINPFRVKIHGASLACYINGDNQQGMSLKQTRTAIQLLSDQLHLDIGKAKVTRLDLGRNIITKFTPEIYIPYLGESNGYKRLEAGDGLYYKNTLRTLVFYNKIQEQKARRNEIAEPFTGRNLLRYELRLTTNLERELNRPRIDGNLLCDEDFYIQLGKMWRDQYLKITKRSSQTATIPPTGSTLELTKMLAAIAVQRLGDENLLRMISEWQQKNELSKKQASDHRKLIRDIVKKEMKVQGNEFIEELDKKVKQSVRFFI